MRSSTSLTTVLKGLGTTKQTAAEMQRIAALPTTELEKLFDRYANERCVKPVDVIFLEACTIGHPMRRKRSRPTK